MIILVDIDGTLTAGDIFIESDDPTLWRNGVLHLIADHHARQLGVPLAESRARLRRFAEELVWWDYPDFIAEFGLDPVPIVADLAAFHACRLRARPAAVATVRALAAAGHTLGIISNNPVTGCLWKLRGIGLAEDHGAPLFRYILGSNNLRGQKSQPAMWRRVVAHLGVAPGDILTIGDNAREDGELPASVGIVRGYILGGEAPPGRIALPDWSAIAAHLLP